MKNMTLAAILHLLYRSLNVLVKHDGSVKAELSQLHEGACVRICTDLAGQGPVLAVVYENGRLRRVRGERRADIEIAFKSLSGALRVFTGLESIGQAYCGHRFVLQGNINETMCLVRAIETAEGYLFPRMWNKRILKRRVDKQLPTMAVYALALCGRV